MTNNITSVNSDNNTLTYNKRIAETAGQAFSSILQAKMNAATMSIADFSDVNGNSSSSSNNLFNSSSLYGSNGLGGYNMFSGMTGGSAGVQSGVGSQTMLALIFLAMAVGSGNNDSTNALLSSLTGALTGNTNGLSGSNYRSMAYQNTLNNSYRGLSLTGSAYKSTAISPGTGNYPSNSGVTCSPRIVNNVGYRSSNAYNQVIKQFNIETSPRYTPYKNGYTYCNIYVWDVTKAMGAEIPYMVDSKGDIATSSTSGFKYQTANSMANWLSGKGKEYGWKEVSAEEAQKYANMGCPAVASWKNNGGIGHIQMVVPSRDGRYNPSKGVAISQAGSKVMEYGYISDVYKSSRLKDIKYYVHA